MSDLWKNERCVRRLAALLHVAANDSREMPLTGRDLDSRAEYILQWEPTWSMLVLRAEFYLRQIEGVGEPEATRCGPEECGQLLVTGERCTRCARHPGSHGVWEHVGAVSYRLREVDRSEGT